MTHRWILIQIEASKPIAFLKMVARIFCPKTCLIARRVVMCMTHGWILVQTEAGQPAAFLKMIADQEKSYPGIISHTQPRKYV